MIVGTLNIEADVKTKYERSSIQSYLFSINSLLVKHERKQ